MRIVKKVLLVLGWTFSILYVYLSLASAYEWFAPKGEMYCATPLFSAIAFLFFPLGILMAIIIYGDYRSLREPNGMVPTWLKAAKVARMSLGSLAVISMALIAAPLFVYEIL